MNLESLLKYIKRIGSGDTSISELKEVYKDVVKNSVLIRQEIDKKYTLKQLKSTLWTSDTKKADCVDSFYHRLLGEFQLGKPMHWSFGDNRSHEDLIWDIIETHTEDDYKTYVEDLIQRRASRKKTYEDPETLTQFSDFVSVFGYEKLNDDQRCRYDNLVADSEIERQKKEKVKQISATSTDAEFELQETVHSKKGHDLFVVVMNKRVERDEFKSLNTTCKRLGGYYSSYRKDGAIPGFQFIDKTKAEEFIKLQTGGGSITIDTSKPDSPEKAAEKLRLMAESDIEKWEEVLNADRKTNTAKRIREANSAENSARGHIAFAKSLLAFSDALGKGEIKYLKNVSAKTHLEAMHWIEGRGNYRARRAKAEQDKIQFEKVEVTMEETLLYVDYPFPEFYIENLDSFLKKTVQEPGLKLLSNRIYKKARQRQQQNRGKRTFLKHIVQFDHYDIADLQKLVDRSSLGKYDKEKFVEELKDYRRIHDTLKIRSINHLRAAIREWNQFSNVQALSDEDQLQYEIKQMEREFVAKKIDGFFPTSKELSEQVVYKADIIQGMTILEPSVGIGHLAEVIRRKHPDNDLTVIEFDHSMHPLLKKKGFNLHEDDNFLDHKEKYDRIIMNPPFEKDQDIDHVMHAFSLLKPGGRLVAIMAANKRNSQRKKRQQFVDFVDEHGWMVDNAEGAFKSAFRPTSVNTIMVCLDKEGEFQSEEIQEETTLKIPTIKEISCETIVKTKDGLIIHNYNYYDFEMTIHELPSKKINMIYSPHLYVHDTDKELSKVMILRAINDFPQNLYLPAQTYNLKEFYDLGFRYEVSPGKYLTLSDTFESIKTRNNHTDISKRSKLKYVGADTDPVLSPTEEEKLRTQEDILVDKIAQDMNMSPGKLLKIAKKLNDLRSIRSTSRDNIRASKQTLVLTPHNVLRWSRYPGRYDLVGVDSPEDSQPTIGFRSLKKYAHKAKIMNMYNLSI